MHEILRKRIMRRLEALPEAKLYQILDYIEFVESRYGEPSTPPTGLQSFAERLEDRMRARSVVPTVMSGTMKVFGAAGKVLDEVSSVGRGLVEGIGEGLAPPAGTGPRAVPDDPSAEEADATPDPALDAGGRTPRALDEDRDEGAPRMGDDSRAHASPATATGPVLADDGEDPLPA